MKNRKVLSILVLIILVLSFIVAAYGVFSHGGPGQYDFKSVHGETVKIYGKGLYRYDSVSLAVQGIAQDKVTLLLGIPLLALSFVLTRKGLLKGRLMLAGTLGYFLYTYTSYTFLSMYNPLFLAYVILMSSSLTAFILTMMSFDLEKLGSYFNEKLPVKLIGGALLFISFSLATMWLGRIVPPLVNGTVPLGLEHYSTLPIQAMDLGFVVPAGVLGGVFVLRRKPLGYLIASIIIIKGSTMLTAISAMVVGMINAGEKVSIIEIALFPAFNVLIILCLVSLLKNIKEPQKPVIGG